MPERVQFTAMADGTAAEFQLVDRVEEEAAADLVDRLVTHLGLLHDQPTAFRVTRYEHSLQSATRALRDGADERTVVAALLHDIGDTLAPFNHSALAAAILRPYVGEKLAWIVEHHGWFQGWWFFHHTGGDRNARERFRGHPWFDAAHDFCERWDQCAFDPDYDTLPIEAFEPMMRRVFATPWPDGRP